MHTEANVQASAKRLRPAGPASAPPLPLPPGQHPTHRPNTRHTSTRQPIPNPLARGKSQSMRSNGVLGVGGCGPCPLPSLAVLCAWRAWRHAVRSRQTHPITTSQAATEEQLHLQAKARPSNQPAQRQGTALTAVHALCMCAAQQTGGLVSPKWCAHGVLGAHVHAQASAVLWFACTAVHELEGGEGRELMHGRQHRFPSPPRLRIPPLPSPHMHTHTETQTPPPFCNTHVGQPQPALSGACPCTDEHTGPECERCVRRYDAPDHGGLSGTPQCCLSCP